MNAETETVTAHPKPPVPFKQLPKAEREALILAIAGKYRTVMRSSDEFIARKRIEFELEEMVYADRA